jgi:hypothetical protein
MMVDDDNPQFIERKEKKTGKEKENSITQAFFWFAK